LFIRSCDGSDPTRVALQGAAVRDFSHFAG
jgi:hypothetical protein